MQIQGNIKKIEKVTNMKQDSNYVYNLDLNFEDYRLLLYLLHRKTTFSILKCLKTSQEDLLKKIFTLCEKFDILANPDDITIRKGYDNIYLKLLIKSLFSKISFMPDTNFIQQVSNKISYVETRRNWQRVNKRLNKLEIDVIKGIIEGRSIEELNQALSFYKKSYNKVSLSIIHKMDAQTFTHAVYKAIKLQIV